jgi:hypothetical protein
LGYRLQETVTVIRDDLVDVRVSEPTQVEPSFHPGVEVRITELERAYRSLEPDQAVNSLAQIFALYLTDYSELSIFVEHERVDPSKLIANRQRIALADIIDGEAAYPVELELIEWTINSERWVFLCSEDGCSSAVKMGFLSNVSRQISTRRGRNSPPTSNLHSLVSCSNMGCWKWPI